MNIDIIHKEVEDEVDEIMAELFHVNITLSEFQDACYDSIFDEHQDLSEEDCFLYINENLRIYLQMEEYVLKDHPDEKGIESIVNMYIFKYKLQCVCKNYESNYYKMKDELL